MSGHRALGRRLVDASLAACGMLLLTLLAVVAYWTRVPESPSLERATRWPLVGGLASSFREAYLPTRIRASIDADRAGVDRGTAVGGSLRHEPAPPPWTSSRDPDQPRWVWVRDGAILRSAPSATSAELHVVDGFYRLPRLERRGDWFQVWRAGRAAWVHLPGYRADGTDGPPFGDAPRPVGPVAGRPPDEEALELALARLDPGRARRLSLGPYRLDTDVVDHALLRRLDGAASDVERAYVARYGLSPIDRPRAAIVLYADPASYRALRSDVRDLPSLASSGHLASGVAALYVAPFDADGAHDETVSTLVHEIVHLINRRALGPALPPWLDEGLADELASSAIGLNGRLTPGRPGGRRQEAGDRIILTGARSSLWTVRRRLDREPGALRRVLALEREEFLRGDPRLHYDLAASWVRFLLDDSEGRRASTFRAFLAGVAAGESPSIESLVARLEESTEEGWPKLEAAFERWIRLRAAALDA